MKLACASASFHAELLSGDLTQLEFLDLCARELPCDGVVLDVRHFPRTDEQYLAQIKKMAADTGLSIAAVQDGAFTAGNDDTMRATLALAANIGAPLLAVELSQQTSTSWSDELERLGSATGLAKAANVTLAIGNALDTFAATAADVKRAIKESDSAWARIALDGAAIDDRALGKLSDRIVMLWAAAPAAWLAEFAGFRGFVVWNGEGDVEAARAALRDLRAALPPL